MAVALTVSAVGYYSYETTQSSLLNRSKLITEAHGWVRRLGIFPIAGDRVCYIHTGSNGIDALGDVSLARATDVRIHKLSSASVRSLAEVDNVKVSADGRWMLAWAAGLHRRFYVLSVDAHQPARPYETMRGEIVDALWTPGNSCLLLEEHENARYLVEYQPDRPSQASSVPLNANIDRLLGITPDSGEVIVSSTNGTSTPLIMLSRISLKSGAAISAPWRMNVPHPARFWSVQVAPSADAVLYQLNEYESSPLSKLIGLIPGTRPYGEHAVASYYVGSLDGRAVTPVGHIALRPSTSGPDAFTWSQDGHRLLYLYDGKLMTVEADR